MLPMMPCSEMVGGFMEGLVFDAGDAAQVAGVSSRHAASPAQVAFRPLFLYWNAHVLVWQASLYLRIGSRCEPTTRQG